MCFTEDMENINGGETATEIEWIDCLERGVYVQRKAIKQSIEDLLGVHCKLKS